MGYGQVRRRSVANVNKKKGRKSIQKWEGDDGKGTDGDRQEIFLLKKMHEDLERKLGDIAAAGDAQEARTVKLEPAYVAKRKMSIADWGAGGDADLAAKLVELAALEADVKRKNRQLECRKSGVDMIEDGVDLDAHVAAERYKRRQSALAEAGTAELKKFTGEDVAAMIAGDPDAAPRKSRLSSHTRRHAKAAHRRPSSAQMLGVDRAQLGIDLKRIAENRHRIADARDARAALIHSAAARPESAPARRRPTVAAKDRRRSKATAVRKPRDRDDAGEGEAWMAPSWKDAGSPAKDPKGGFRGAAAAKAARKVGKKLFEAAEDPAKPPRTGRAPSLFDGEPDPAERHAHALWEREQTPAKALIHDPAPVVTPEDDDERPTPSNVSGDVSGDAPPETSVLSSVVSSSVSSDPLAAIARVALPRRRRKDVKPVDVRAASTASKEASGASSTTPTPSREEMDLALERREEEDEEERWAPRHGHHRGVLAASGGHHDIRAEEERAAEDVLRGRRRHVPLDEPVFLAPYVEAREIADVDAPNYYREKVRRASYAPVDARGVVRELEDDWHKREDAVGGLFYENARTGESRWNAPLKPEVRAVYARLKEEGPDTVSAASTTEPALRYEGATQELFGLALSGDGASLAVAGEDGAPKIFDAATGAVRRTLLGHEGIVTGIALSRDGRSVATAGRDGTARLWDAASAKCSLVLAGHTGWLSSVAFSADGTRVATAAYDETARVWSAATGERLSRYEDRGRRGRRGGGVANYYYAVAFDEAGERLATASRDGVARTWDARYDASGDAAARVLLRLEGHRGPVTGVAWSEAGTRVATCSKDRTARLWCARTGHPQATLDHPAHVLSIAFSADGAHVATGAHDATARLWHVGHFCDETYRWLSAEVTTLEAHGERITGIAFGPDGRRVYTCAFDRIAIAWDLAHILGPPPVAEHASVLSALTPHAEGAEEGESWVD